MTAGVEYLCRRDPDLARIFERLGMPPLWAREPGFACLVQIILEQQVSLVSARAAYNKLLGLISSLNPKDFLVLSDAELKTAGFSRQKTLYCRYLAETIVSGQLNLEALPARDDAFVKAELTKIKGIGQWTADIYLLMALNRPDAWPSGDLALAVAFRELKGLQTTPTFRELEAAAENWRPWRAVAARLLWQHYLDKAFRIKSVRGEG